MRINLNRLSIKNSVGDTIIEVLIAITLLSLLLAGALALTQKSLQDERSSQEHNEALELAQSQIEEIRNYASLRVLPTSSFCMISTGGVVNTQPASSGTCTVNAADVAVTPPLEPEYVITITPPTGSVNNFTVNVTWNSNSGVGNDSVTLYYQIYS